MMYYVNENSIDSQFKSIEDFSDSLIETTIPMIAELEKLVKEKCIYYKKDDLWNRIVYDNFTLYEIIHSPKVKKASFSKIRLFLMKMVNEAPFFDIPNTEPPEIKLEPTFTSLERINCFWLAAENDCDIISFCHKEFNYNEVRISYDNKDYLLYNLHNKTSLENYKSKLQNIGLIFTVKSRWYFEKYRVEVRIKEENCNTPHVHFREGKNVISYSLENFEILEKTPLKWTVPNKSEHMEFLKNNLEELINAWNTYHPDRLVKK